MGHPYQCWAYDNFGNRTNELESNSTCPTTLTNGTSTHWWQYGNANNQVTSSDTLTGGLVYDSAGDVIQDAHNRYAYDVEGRVCAVLGSGPTYTQYVYDAEGRRVAKGSIPSFPATGQACAAPTAANGFTLTNTYLRGSDGNQDTELTSAGLWHTNVFASGELLATYDYNPAVSSSPVLSYNFEDWLGTKRMQSTAAGGVAMSWSSDPFGDYLNATGSAGDATEQHFTGKERDAESGLDYFGARYYGSSMGRWMSPDWSAKEEPVPYAKLDDPQSLNLYSYVGNNPLSNVDSDGHQCDWCNEFGRGFGNTTLVPLWYAVHHPTTLVTGPASMIAHPVNTWNSLYATTQAAGRGEGYATGEVWGTIASFALLKGAKAPAPVIAPMMSAEDTLVSLAGKAMSSAPQGSNATITGTFAHTAFADAIRALGDPNIHAEVSYLNGVEVPYGTKGSVRFDAITGPRNAPTAGFDLKTGASGLSASRVADMRANLPQASQNMPISEIRK